MYIIILLLLLLVCLQTWNENKGDQVVGFICGQNTAGVGVAMRESDEWAMSIPSAVKKFERKQNKWHEWENRQYILINQYFIAGA